MSSIYDQYHSDKNINHLYNYMNTILEKKTGINILQNIEYFNYFSNYLREHFVKSEKSTLQELNHELLEKTLVEIYRKIISSQKKEIILENSHIIESNNKENIESDNKEVIESDNKEVIDKFNNYVNDRNIKLKETSIESLNKETSIESLNKETSFIFSSFNRLQDNNSTRFNYKINNNNNLSKFSKLIIPIEKIVLFSSPLINLNIIELDMNISLILDKTYNLNNYNYGEYIPLNDININKQSDILSIKINSIYNSIDYENDILKGVYDNNKKNIIVNELVDINENDIINIFNENKKIYTEVISLENNNINIEDNNLEDKENFKIINMNLQNILIFN